MPCGCHEPLRGGVPGQLTGTTFSMITHPDDVAADLEGCRFALDDFGSFDYLKHLPFDYLKIDGEFVSGCLTGRTDQLVIEAVVRIARGLGHPAARVS